MNNKLCIISNRSCLSQKCRLNNRWSELPGVVTQVPLEPTAEYTIIWVVWWNPQPPQTLWPPHQATYWLCLLTFVPHQMWFSDYCQGTIQLCKRDRWEGVGNFLQRRPAKHYWFLSGRWIKKLSPFSGGTSPNDLVVNMKYQCMPVSLYLCVWDGERGNERKMDGVTGEICDIWLFLDIPLAKQTRPRIWSLPWLILLADVWVEAVKGLHSLIKLKIF